MDDSNVEIRRTEDKGKGLFALKSFKKGDVIFEEVPFVSCQFAWNEDYGYLACELCLRPLETTCENVTRLTSGAFSVLPYPELCVVDKSTHTFCSHCGVKYCSAECQEVAWNKYHKSLCLQKHERDTTHPLEILKETWKKMHYPPETISIIILAKIFAMVHQSEDKEALKCILKEFCHFTKNENEDITLKLMNIKFAEQIGHLREVFLAAVPTEDMYEWSTPEGFLSLMALVALNGQGIGTSAFSAWVKNVTKEIPPEKKDPVNEFIEKVYENFQNGVGDFINNEGSGLFLTQSSMNHSCKPNAEITFPNSNYHLAVRAIENINVGDEICISYLDECILERSRHTRQKILKENYVFTCQCEKCLEEINQPDETSSDEEEDEDEEMSES